MLSAEDLSDTASNSSFSGGTMNLQKVVIGILLTCFMVILLGTSGWSQTPVPQDVGTDRMTTNGAGERDAFPDDGQMFYVPWANAYRENN
jgi:hypothetical protein